MFLLKLRTPTVLLAKHIWRSQKQNYSAKPVSTKHRATVLKSPVPLSLQRPVRRDPSPVLWCFLPAEWPRAFYPKTGESGFYTFVFTFTIYLMSKEILVMEHNYYAGISMFILCGITVSLLGPAIAKTLDKKIDKLETDWVQGRENHKKALSDAIDFEVFSQQSMAGQMVVLHAKRENVQFQLEHAYRERLLHVYKVSLKRLVYQCEQEAIERRQQHANIIEYVRTGVINQIKPEMEAENFNRCIDTLQRLAKEKIGK